ncbi:MAG: hypothetical protein E7578_03850 [Ruminococcaceae bacterium]|nr:hypothetical protein [Oscillospiraceae bacterium]
MIHNGRRRTLPTTADNRHNRYAARITAIIGVLVFTAFLCTSVENDNETKIVSADFGEGAYQVFAPTDTAPSDDRDTSATEDSSIWSYLESVIFRLIYGNS